MITCLFGSDDYRREQRKREVIAAFHTKHPAGARANFRCGDPEEREALRAFLGTRPLFASARLAVIEDVAEGESDRDREFLAALQSAARDPSVAAVISARFAPRGALAFLAGKKKIRNRGRDTSAGEVAAEEFEELDSGARAEFLKREAERLGFSLRPDAARLLAGAYAGNTWGAVTELQKAALLGKNPIEGDDLSRTGVSAMPAFWGFIERFRRGNAPSRLAVLEELFALKEPAAKFFNILAYQLPEKMNLVARCDEAVKSGKLDYEEALLALALAEK